MAHQSRHPMASHSAGALVGSHQLSRTERRDDPAGWRVLFAYLLAAALAIGGTVLLFVWAASRIVGGENRWGRFHHLAQSLIPIAGCGVFLGLFALTTTMLHVEGLTVPFIATARSLLMAAACLWSIVLAWRICGLYARTGARASPHPASWRWQPSWGSPPGLLPSKHSGRLGASAIPLLRGRKSDAPRGFHGPDGDCVPF